MASHRNNGSMNASSLLQSNVSLASYNTMAIPATAKALLEVHAMDDIVVALKYVQQHAMPLLVLGGGSNTIFRQDYAGLVMLNRLRGIHVLEENAYTVTVRVAAGENWHDFVKYSLTQGWYGLENLALIPGLVGAAPIQNIGAYGVEIKDVLLSLELIDVATGQTASMTNAECDFAYRESRFKHDLADKVIITAVVLRLSKQPNVNIEYPALAQQFDFLPSPHEVFTVVCDIRSAKLPSVDDYPNAGSFFKNPIISAEHYERLKQDHPELVAFPAAQGMKLAAGWLIDQAGWKNKHDRGVRVHQQQALVLINPDRCSGDDIIAYANAIQNDIQHRYGVALEIEPRVYG